MQTSIIPRLFLGALNFTLSLFAPPCCRLCQAPLFGHENPYLCGECAGKVAWIGRGACPKCGYPAGEHATLEQGCRRCRSRSLDLTGAAAVASYKAGARELVLRLKFGKEMELARPLGGLMAERLLAAPFREKLDVIVPVALHPLRLRERGFDQARLLAGEISRRVGLPVERRSLKRLVATTPQSRLRRQLRLTNVENAFKADGRIAGKRVLLVDDVMTTGATMAACSRACRAAGATRVYGLVFAR